jgi:hypothetical protein
MQDPSNTSLADELIGNTKHPQYKQHARMVQGEDLHMALKSCDEIGSAKTMLQFMLDL